MPVEFVGHPLVDLATPSAPRDAFLRGLGLAPRAPTVAILPGQPAERSQPDSAGSWWPPPGGFARRSPARSSSSRARPHLDDDLFDVVQARGVSPAVVVEGETDAVLASADVALTASGTATVQTAIARHADGGRLPAVAADLSPRPPAREARHVRHGQSDCRRADRAGADSGRFTPEAVAGEAISMLTDPARAARIREGLARVRTRLGGPGASRRAAEAILERVMNIDPTRSAGLCLHVRGRSPVSATVVIPADLGELSREALAIARGRVVAARRAMDRRSPASRDHRHARGRELFERWRSALFCNFACPAAARPLPQHRRRRARVRRRSARGRVSRRARPRRALRPGP